MRCPNCEAEVAEGEKFCPQCGVPFEAIIKCPHCGAALLPGEQFCGDCGRPVRPAEPPTMLVPPVGPSVRPPVGPPPAKKSPWLWIGIGAGALAILGCMVVCVLLVFIPAMQGAGGTLVPTVPVTASWLSTSTPIPPPTSVPTPGVQMGMLLYEEDFSDPGEEWEIENNEEAEYKLDGEMYSVEVRKVKWMAWNSVMDEFADFALDFDATLVEGDIYNSYGCLFRYLDKGDHYELDINGNGSFSFGRNVAGEWTLLKEWTASPAIRPLGQANHVRLVAYGNTFTLYINDQLVHEFADEAHLNGEIALLVTAYDNPPARAVFDNVQIHDVELR